MDLIRTYLEAVAKRPKPLPVPVCSVVANVLGDYHYSHKALELLFYEAGATGEVPDGNCVTKCESWLKRMHDDVPDPAAVLGKVLEKFMEVDDTFRLRYSGARAQTYSGHARQVWIDLSHRRNHPLELRQHCRRNP